jgi:hypothetical protein
MNSNAQIRKTADGTAGRDVYPESPEYEATFMNNSLRYITRVNMAS